MTRLVLRVGVHRLVVGANHPPGLDLTRVERLVAGRCDTRLPVVIPLVGSSLYEIQRGRHRYVAALVRGERSLLVEVQPPGNAAGPPPRGAEGQRFESGNALWVRAAHAIRQWAARRRARRLPPPA